MIQTIQTETDPAACDSAAASPSAQIGMNGSDLAIARIDSRRGTLIASHVHGVLGLAAATAMAAMIPASAYPGWTVAISTGLLCCGIIHAVRQDTPGWPLQELATGMVLCLAMMCLPLLHAAYGLAIWLYVVPLVLAGILLLLWTLTRRTFVATVSARAMLAAIPPLATAMHTLR